MSSSPNWMPWEKLILQPNVFTDMTHVIDGVFDFRSYNKIEIGILAFTIKLRLDSLFLIKTRLGFSILLLGQIGKFIYEGYKSEIF